MKTIRHLFKNSLLLLLPLLFGVSVVQGQITLPYTETFAGISAANGFPTVAGGAWTRTGTNNTQPTYIANQASYNRSGNGDTKFMSFRYSQAAAGGVFAVGPFALTAGVTYSVSVLYKADGSTGFGPLSLTYGTGTTAALQSNVIASVPASITNASFQTLAGNFSPATTGSYYLGIKCLDNGNPWYLTVDDFSVAVLPGCSGTPTGGTTRANSTASTVGACLSNAVSFDVTGSTTGSGLAYQWQYSASGSGYTDISGATSSTYSIASLSAGNIGYYQRVTTCTASTQSATSTPVQVTQNAFYYCYCNSVPSSVDNNGVTNITGLGTLTNPNVVVNAPYQNFTSTVAAPDLAMGTTYPTTVSLGTGFSYRVWVFIDYNQNGSFADAGEGHDLGLSTGANPTSVTANITIPATALAGVTGMRIVATDTDGSTTSCYTGTYANVEEYLVNILCPTPTAVTPAASSITATGATLQWTSSATNFDIEYGETGFAQGTGTSATSITNSLAITGLTASTDYQFYVRTNCGSGSYSPWAGPYSFTSGSSLDIQVSAVTVVDNCQANGTSDVTVLVSNVGLTDVNAGDVPLELTIDSNPAGNTFNAATIIGGGQETVTFIGVNLGAAASMVFGVTATTVGDANTANDMASTTQIIGIANAGTATTTASGAICPSVAFNLGLSGVSTSTTTTYQWEKSTDNGATWSNVASATSTTVTGLTQSATTIYHCVLTCGTSTLTSTDVTVTTSPFYDCYCIPVFSSATVDEDIYNVTVGTLNNSSTCNVLGSGAGSVAGGYANYKSGASAPAAPDIAIGATTPFSVTVGYCGSLYTNGIAIWIDTDHSGTFDTGERYYYSSSARNTHISGATAGTTGTVGATAVAASGRIESGTFVIPITALGGLTAMRVTALESGVPSAACTGGGYGETEDYLVNILCPTPTAATPAATAITATGATLGWTSSATNFDIEYGETGFSQGNGTLTTSGTASKAITGLSASTGYEFYVRTNCGSGSYSPWAGPFAFTTGAPLDIAISVVTVVDKCAANGTSDVTVLVSNVGTTDINAGDVTLELTIDSNPAGNISNTTTIIGGGQETVTFTGVNLGAAASMVFGVTATTAGDANAVNDVASTTEMIGIASAGTATTTASNPQCASAAFNLGLSGVSVSSNTTYQWEVSTDNGATWTNLAGATSATVTGITQAVTSTYHCVLTCGATNLTSTDITVNRVVCYCTPVYSSGKTDGDLISNIVIAGTTLSNNSGTDPVNPAYTYFTGQANYTADLQAGVSYNVTVTIGSYATQYVTAWIDYNDDGVFANSERIGSTAAAISTAYGTATFPIVVSCNPPVGVHRLRVREVWGSSGNPASSINACNSYGYGETEDYDVNILPPAPCPAPTSLATSAVTACGVTLNWNAGCTETQWDVHVTTAGGGAPTGAASHPAVTTKPFAVTGLTAGTAYEFWVAADCNGAGNGTSTWTGPVTFTTGTIATPTISAGGATTFCEGGSVTLTSSATSGNTWTPGGVTAASIIANTLGTTNYSVTYTDANNCTATSTPTSVVVNSFPANPGIPTTSGTHYATHACPSSGWTYFMENDKILLGVQMGTWNPGTLVQTTPDAGQYAVRVDVGASMIADLTAAPYNDSTNGGYGSGRPWKVINRTWDLQLFATTQEPQDSVNIKTYFTETEYQAVNGDLLNLADKLTSPSEMTVYKLKRVSQPWANLYATSMAALTAAHAGLDSSYIEMYNNKTVHTEHWTYLANTPSTGVHTAQMKVAEFSGGGGGGGAGGGSPFAVELAYFDGQNQGSYNLLNWVTISELSNRAFEVQRSIDGVSFQTIGTVNTKAVNGTSSNAISYEFADLKPAKNSYYRLKQIDIDGSVNMLPKVVEISLADNFKTAINLFPNPATSELNVAITGNLIDTYLVEVSDIYGRKVASVEQLSNGGTTISTINVKDLAQGTYIVTVKDRTNSIVSTQRFIKE